MDKFQQLDNGNYVNVRLKDEAEKRANFIQSRIDNGAKDGRPKKKKKPYGKPLAKPYGKAKHNLPEDENVNENKGLDRVENNKVALPFSDNEFEKAWQIWKEYKLDEHKFKYKSTESERQALIKLGNLAGGDRNKAFKIIHNSIANGWKGFFQLEPETTNGELSVAEQILQDIKKNKK